MLKLSCNAHLQKFLFYVEFSYRSRIQNRLVFRRILRRARRGATQQMLLVSGWRTRETFDFCLSRPVRDLLSYNLSAEQVDLKPVAWVSGTRIGGAQSGAHLAEVLKSIADSGIPCSFPIEIVRPFVHDKADGNFNSLTGEKFNTDLAQFRADPNFHFLTPGSRVTPSKTEHYQRLLNMRISRGEILHDLNRLTELSRVDSKRLDGLVWHMDVIHYFFLRSISQVHKHESALRVVEIGGGYWGLARQMFLLGHLKPIEYTIIDLPMTLGLIEQYLHEELDPDDFRKINFIDARTVSASNPLLDKDGYLGIATHSLSELDPEIIDAYFAQVIPYCSSFLLSMQRRFNINNLDFDWLFKRFQDLYNLDSLQITESRNVINAMFGSLKKRQP